MTLAHAATPASAGLDAANLSYKHDSMDANVDSDPPSRDSRALDCHIPIPEEDESNETASEPAEPVTPTSDSHPPSFQHHDGQIDTVVPSESEMKTKPATLAPVPRPPPTPRSQTNASINDSNLKPALSKRVGSFVRKQLHRTPSQKDVSRLSSEEQVSGRPSLDNPTDSTTVVMPKTRRLSSFSLSARSTPKSSHSNSPPSPSSPTSTISHGQGYDMPQNGTFGHKHSTSSTGLNKLNRPRSGITWAGAKDKGPRNHFRRRSASTEMISKPALAEPGVALLDTFSRPAAEGVGMKARRLSLSLPDEFMVDYCELDKEFKSSSLMPGKRGKCLGKGATAEVRIMSRKGVSGGEELVAVKEFRGKEKDENDDEYIKKIKSEYSIAKSLHHPNIVETVRLCENKGRWNHVMEFCNYGELYSLVERKLFTADGFYSLNDRLCFFKQLLRGVDYLHCHGIAHRDIKLENLLLDRSGHLKLSDFGVAEVFSGEHPGLRTAMGECGKNMGEVRLSKPGICGSLPYIAPEVLEKAGDYDPRPLDVWSCAIVFLAMTFGGCPWQAAKPQWDNYARFKKGWDDWLPTHPDGLPTDGPDGFPKCGRLFAAINPPGVKRILLKMLHPIPGKRISIRDVITSPYIRSIDCCCPESYEDPACCIDTSKCNSKQTSKMTAQKKFLHHHIPPAPEKRFAKAFQHRFDMGEGWY